MNLEIEHSQQYSSPSVAEVVIIKQNIQQCLWNGKKNPWCYWSVEFNFFLDCNLFWVWMKEKWLVSCRMWWLKNKIKYFNYTKKTCECWIPLTTKKFWIPCMLVFCCFVFYLFKKKEKKGNFYGFFWCFLWLLFLVGGGGVVGCFFNFN